MKNVWVIDDSILGDFLSKSGTSHKAYVIEDVCDVQNLHLKQDDVCAVHLSCGLGSRTLLSGIDAVLTLRRDHRFQGRIILYSIEPLETLEDANVLLRRVTTNKDSQNNFDYYLLPENADALLNSLGTENESQIDGNDLADFVINCTDLQGYFSTHWGDMAHTAQSGSWDGVFPEPHYSFLLRNTRDFGPPWMKLRLSEIDTNGSNGSLPTRVAELYEALDFLKSRTDPADNLVKRGAILELIGIIQMCLGLKRIQPLLRDAPVIREYSFIYIADDDGYDPYGLSQLGYRVETESDPATVREFLQDERPPVFLCDLTWEGDRELGVQLAKEAVKLHIPVVILMSAGPVLREDLSGIIICEGVTHKYNASYIHQLILSAAKKE